MTTIETITDRIVLVMLSISIWSGRKKLRPEDLHLSDGEIPPEELVSLGSKRICDPDALKGFSRIKQSAERACLKVGTRFLGGFAVPQDYADDVAQQLDALRAEFEAERTTFLGNYDQALEQWISTLPEFEAPIRRAVEPANVVGGRLRFAYQLVEIKPAEQPGTLIEEVEQLGNGIFAEVEQMARDLESSFEGKDRLHRRALGTFSRVRDKLACLSFIDPRIQPVVDSVDDWLDRLPATAAIEGAIFNEGMGLALLLSDAERMARHGAGQLALQEGAAAEESTLCEPEQSEPEQLPFVDFDALFEAEPEHAEDADTTPAVAPPQEEPASFFF
jgi:hypothetical protein